MRQEDHSQGYRRRNAYAAAIESLVRSCAKPEQNKLAPDKNGFEFCRVQTSEWVYGFFMDCTGLDRKTEGAILDEVDVMFPKLKSQVMRKTTSRSRYVEFSFSSVE
jgi:hypothetical protein